MIASATTAKTISITAANPESKEARTSYFDSSSPTRIAQASGADLVH
jgi:hypothetical protein